MGSKQSKQQVSSAAVEPKSFPETSVESVPPSEDDSALPNQPKQTSSSSTNNITTKQGGCPMKNKTGSYFGGFWGMKNNPHIGSNATIPLTSSGDVVKSDKNESDSPKKEQSSSVCPVMADTKKGDTSSSGRGGCPMKMNGKKNDDQVQYNVYSQPIDPKNNMPAVENQLPAAQQKVALSTDRVNSNIPKGGTDSGTTWTYPSPQMFYNALARKNKLEDTDESAIESVVAIHNNMNEKTWASVVEWEAVTNPDGVKQGGPKLLKFMGRPSDLSPKARFKHMVLGHPLPFDRHDWTIVRSDGTEVRYIIDYYMDESQAKETEESAMPKMEDREAVKSVLIDVRPALDSPTNLLERGVFMPYARNVAKTTPFRPLPLMPTDAMKDQTIESEKTWESIQRNVQQSKGGANAKPISMVLSKEQISGENESAEDIQISKEEAIKVAENFAKMLRECQDAQKIVDECTNDAECAKASLGLSLCMAKLVCPLQHQAVTKSLKSDDLDENDEKYEEIYDKRVTAALGNVSDCIALEGHRAAVAKDKFPELFQ
jgi:cytochrome c heme-lyase